MEKNFVIDEARKNEIEFDAKYYARQYEDCIEMGFQYPRDSEWVDMSKWFNVDYKDNEDYDNLQTDEERICWDDAAIAEFRRMIDNAAANFGFEPINFDETVFKKIKDEEDDEE